MSKFRLNLLKALILLALTAICLCCLIHFTACEDEEAQLTKVELVDGTYQTEYKLGEAPTLCGAELKLTFSNNTVKHILVTEEMVEQYSAENNLAFVPESDVSYDDEGNGFVITNQSLIAKYSNFIVDAQISIELPSYVTLSNGMISGYKNLSPGEILVVPETVTLKSGNKIEIKGIENNALRNAPISGIVLPHTVSSIGRYAFKDCKSLKQVLFISNGNGETSLSSIVAQAFDGCTSLESIDLPKSIQELDLNAFSNCKALKEINIEKGCTNYYSPYGNAYKGVVYHPDVDIDSISIDNAYIWPEGKNCSTLTMDYGEGEYKTYTGPVGEKVEVITPFKQYYVFDGWYADKDFTQPVDELILGESNSTVYAKWEISPSAAFSIFYENDWENNNPTFYYTVNRDIKLNSPERKGYKFIAWYEKLDDGSRIKNDLIPTGSEGDKTFIAEWEVISYTISFSLCEGKFDNDYPNPLIYTIENENIEVPVPVRDGYEFAGWEEHGQNLGKNYTVYSGSTGYHTLMAKWEAINYDINVELNGGKTDTDIQPTYTVEDNIKLPNPTRTGYDFIGWLVNGENCGTDYTIVSGSTGTLIIEAEWQEVSYKITYNLKGAINSEEFPLSYTINSEVIHIPLPIYKGYHFIEWKGGKGESLGAEYVIPTGSHEDIELTAERENNEYTVYYSANNGTGEISSEPDYVTYGHPKLAPSCAFGKDGYSFVGWKVTGAESEGQVYEENFDLSQLIAEHEAVIILSVEWGANIYEVVFESNDGESKNYSFEYKYDKPTNLPKNTFTYKGNNFKGWAFTPDGEVKFFDEQEVDNDVLNGNIDLNTSTTLYALWAKKEYTLDLNYVVTDYKVDEEKNKVEYNQVITVSSPTKTAYAFSGWYYNDIKITFGQYEVDGSGKIINGFGIIEGETGEKLLAEFDAYSDRNEAIPLTAKWTPITYRFTVKDEKDPANEKAVEFTYEDSKTTQDIRHDKFGQLFKAYTLSGSNYLKNGNTTITSFTEIKKGTYATGVTPVFDGKGGYVATINDIVSEQYGKVSESFDSYQIDHGVVIFDLKKRALKLSKDFYVSSKITVLNIIGKDSYNYTDFSLHIQSRSTKLKICFENFNYTASALNNGITANSNFPLEICYLGKNSITGASGVRGKDGVAGTGYAVGERAADGSTGANGSSAAYKKGEAINGKQGGKGADGKNGGNGKNGTNGGNGCAAISVYSMPKFKSVNNGKLTLCGGNGGNGGDGGAGGRGQDGGNGGKGGDGGKSFWFIGIAGYTEYGNGGKGGNNGNGGNGGKGGNAGAGGKAGEAISYSINTGTSYVNLYRIAGKAGKAGVPGKGGACGIKGNVGDGGANGKGQWYGALAGGSLINIIVEAARNGGGQIGLPGDDTAKNGAPGADGIVANS